MELIATDIYRALTVSEEQSLFVAAPEMIRKALRREDTFGFYAVIDGAPIGFAMLRQLGPKEFFLWEYLIDRGYQGKGWGRAFLTALVERFRREYDMQVLWTTYIWGNDAAAL